MTKTNDVDPEPIEPELTIDGYGSKMEELVKKSGLTWEEVEKRYKEMIDMEGGW